MTSGNCPLTISGAASATSLSIQRRIKLLGCQAGGQAASQPASQAGSRTLGRVKDPPANAAVLSDTIKRAGGRVSECRVSEHPNDLIRARARVLTFPVQQSAVPSSRPSIPSSILLLLLLPVSIWRMQKVVILSAGLLFRRVELHICLHGGAFSQHPSSVNFQRATSVLALVVFWRDRVLLNNWCTDGRTDGRTDLSLPITVFHRLPGRRRRRRLFYEVVLGSCRGEIKAAEQGSVR